MTDDTKINPMHYQQGRVSCIDYIEDRLGYSGFKQYLLGSHYKYTYRFKYKHKHLPKLKRKQKELEDLQKSQWYLDRYQNMLKKELELDTEQNNIRHLHNDSVDIPSDTEAKNESWQEKLAKDEDE